MRTELKKREWNFGRMTWTGMLCLALLNGQAFARSGPVVKKDKPAPSVQAKTTVPKTGEDTAAKPDRDGKKNHKRIDTTMRNHPFELDPNAKLVCEQATVTAKPVWEGTTDKLTFSFNLRNAGTADLKIKAKGG